MCWQKQLLPPTELVVPNLDLAEALHAHATRRAILGNEEIWLLLRHDALAHESTLRRRRGGDDDAGAAAAVAAERFDALTSRKDARRERDYCNRRGQMSPKMHCRTPVAGR
jgi:hypothetical protein